MRCALGVFSYSFKEFKMAEIKLNIYNKNKVVKTYKTSDLFVEVGLVEDIFKLVDIDKLLDKSTSEEDLGKMVLKLVIKGWGSFKAVILELFEGLTEEEFKHTRLNEVASVILAIVMGALTSLNNIETGKKN